MQDCRRSQWRSQQHSVAAQRTGWAAQALRKRCRHSTLSQRRRSRRQRCKQRKHHSTPTPAHVDHTAWAESARAHCLLLHGVRSIVCNAVTRGAVCPARVQRDGDVFWGFFFVAVPACDWVSCVLRSFQLKSQSSNDKTVARRFRHAASCHTRYVQLNNRLPDLDNASLGGTD